jgi:hypothetical protein
MDDPNNQVSPDLNEKPEDAALETQALAPTSDEAIRAKVLEKLSLADVPENEEYIAKLVDWQKEENKKLATAIRQKQGWREKATKPTPTAVVTPAAPKPTAEVPDVAQLVDARLNERLDEEKLREVTLTDEAKKELKAYAKAQNITAREALSTPYFQFLKDQEERKQREDDAAISRTNKSPAKTAFSEDKPPADLDMSTPEGQAKWDEWVAWASKQK